MPLTVTKLDSKEVKRIIKELLPEHQYVFEVRDNDDKAFGESVEVRLQFNLRTFITKPSSGVSNEDAVRLTLTWLVGELKRNIVAKANDLARELGGPL